MTEPTRGGTTLDLLFANRDGLVGDVVAGGHRSTVIVKLQNLQFLVKQGEASINFHTGLPDSGLFKRLIQSSLGSSP